MHTYFIYGKHATLAALQNPKRSIKKAFCIKDFWQNPDFKKYINMHHFQEKTRAELDKLLGTNCVHQGIAIETQALTCNEIKDLDLSKEKTIVILDQITDMHNFGSILRSASTFGTKIIITASKNCVKENGTLAKTSSGALEMVQIVEVVNINQTIEFLKKIGFWIIGLDHNANSYLHNYSIPNQVAIILGSEGSGIRKLTKEKCDSLVKIPILQENSLDSLNVSVAASISLYEIFKQRI